MGGLVMKRQAYLLNLLLTMVVGLVCLVVLLVRAFAPAVVLPKLGLPLLVLLSLVALVMEGYLSPGAGRPWIALVLLGGVTLALLPWCAGWATGEGLLRLFLLGGATFGITTFLFTSMAERLASGPAHRVALALSAVLLFLASQALSGILL